LSWHCHTADDFGEISEVEGVVSFHRSWFEVSSDLLIHFHGSSHDL
jgi:hypothetical protein